MNNVLKWFQKESLLEVIHTHWHKWIYMEEDSVFTTFPFSVPVCMKILMNTYIISKYQTDAHNRKCSRK